MRKRRPMINPVKRIASGQPKPADPQDAWRKKQANHVTARIISKEVA
jgi:hypothetical protein